jgi:nickel transport protein
MRRGIAIAPLFLAALLFPALLAAHGVEVSRVTGETEFGAETVRFMYSTGEEMSFAVVRIFAPSRPDVEILQSLTDPNGYFSFIPYEEGEWRVSAEDDMGHRGEIRINVGGGNTGAAETASGGPLKTPLVLRLILGLSLILNIFAAYRFMLGRRVLAAGAVPPRDAPGKGEEHAY